MTGDEREGNIINAAIQEGLSAILKSHPRFKDQETYLRRHLDALSIEKNIMSIQKYIEQKELKEGRELSEENKSRIFYEKLSESAAAGRLFDDVGKEVILRQSLEERAKNGPMKRSASGALKGEHALDNTTAAFKDIYALLKTGDYAQHMPEFAKAVSIVYNMGFLDSSVDLLRHYGLIDRSRYKVLKQSIRKRAEEGVEETTHAIENYSGLKKVAAIALGISGLSEIIVSGGRLTGNTIGQAAAVNIGAFVGFSSILIAFLLFINWQKLN